MLLYQPPRIPYPHTHACVERLVEERKILRGLPVTPPHHKDALISFRLALNTSTISTDMAQGWDGSLELYHQTRASTPSSQYEKLSKKLLIEGPRATEDIPPNKMASTPISGQQSVAFFSTQVLIEDPRLLSRSTLGCSTCCLPLVRCAQPPSRPNSASGLLD
eukprot:6180227-Pleurochrysis_carterae.AAC.3